MKKIIELLERVEAAIMLATTETEDPDSLNEAINIINDVMAELKTPCWIPYKNLTAAHDRMSKAIKAVEEVTFRSRDEEKRIKTALNWIECAMGAIETLIPLPLPRWETPEQWEKRTGKAWPDDWATYVRLIFAKHGWDPYRYITAKSLQLSHPGTIIVIATEAGPPPNDWRPEE